MKKRITLIMIALMVVVAFAVAVKNVHTINAKLCTNCTECEKVCPEDCISEGVVNGNKVRIIDPKLCTNCGECVKVCPEDCITETPYDKAVSAKTATKAEAKPIAKPDAKPTAKKK